MFRREAPSLPFLDSSVGVHGGRRARRLPPMSSLGLGLCLLSFQWGIHFRAGAAAHVFLRIHRCGLLGARPPCLGLGDQPLLPPLTQRQTLGTVLPRRERVGWVCGLCSNKSSLDLWVAAVVVFFFFFFLANSHQTSPLHWPQLYSFLWRKQVGSPSPWGLGVKQQLLTEP